MDEQETGTQVSAALLSDLEFSAGLIGGLCEALSIIGAVLAHDEDALAEMKRLQDLFIQTLPYRLQRQGRDSPAMLEGYRSGLRHLLEQVEREQAARTPPSRLQ
ncbi:hypothetical protein C5U62_32185 [Pseudomonas protegens]|uniref:Uncharacterized protein n=1 Tax=Pseudomonas protegens TaxID=380021 RepID=A0A2T6GB59_9PSED|nr:hypothetical protein [Pseudomonas protegens]PUA41384.1 hypothetical protein C5U62_32185 [Pseudomonas protegens]